MRITDVMTRTVHCVTPEVTLKQAAGIMADHDIGSLPIALDDKPIGIITPLENSAEKR